MMNYEIFKEVVKEKFICQRGGGKDWQSVRYFT